jgi:LPPG:FO 2-phospho-L-lactate transferase
MKIAALAGGVGGSKLAYGLARVLPVQDLTIIVNTGDDFEHLGLHISPDLDTVCYTLAEIENPVKGWGRRDETYNFLECLKRIGGPDWFMLGDRDLATHIERTKRLREGQLLHQITFDFCRAWGVQQTVLPMSNDPIRTMVITKNDGILPFQEYFVHRNCEPEVKGFRFEGSKFAHPAPGVLEALAQADAIVLCPSNPWVSIDPILKLGNLKDLLKQKRVVAISPIIGGKTIKGPAAKMFNELGIHPSARAVAEHYRDLIDGFILDAVDQSEAEEISHWGIIPLVTNTIMRSTEDRMQLAKDIINFGLSLPPKG